MIFVVFVVVGKRVATAAAVSGATAAAGFSRCVRGLSLLPLFLDALDDGETALLSPCEARVEVRSPVDPPYDLAEAVKVEVPLEGRELGRLEVVGEDRRDEGFHVGDHECLAI